MDTKLAEKLLIEVLPHGADNHILSRSVPIKHFDLGKLRTLIPAIENGAVGSR